MSHSKSLTKTPEPPYYAVIFTSCRTELDDKGYSQMAERMVQLAQTMPGFLGLDSVRDQHGVGITVSYWQSEDDIKHWKQNAEHLRAQEAGKSTCIPTTHSALLESKEPTITKLSKLK